MNSTIAFVMPGGAEWMIIFLVMLLLFGAKKLPELARGIGRSLGEFRKAKDEFEHEINYGEEETRRERERREEAERRRKFAESKKLAEKREAKAEEDAKPADAVGAAKPEPAAKVETAGSENGDD